MLKVPSNHQKDYSRPWIRNKVSCYSPAFALRAWTRGGTLARLGSVDENSTFFALLAFFCDLLEIDYELGRIAFCVSEEFRAEEGNDVV